MSTFVIAGGNSGIGLQVAQDLAAEGHRLILLGRSQAKGRAALESLGAARGRAQFCPVDLSTHDGVRAAARQVAGLTDRIDGLLHSAAEFITREARTADGLPLFVALSYMSRYHLTQLLLPQLLNAPRARVMMMVATLPQVPTFDPAPFPTFPDFDFFRAIAPVNGACMHYADHLTRTHPTLFAGTATPGMVRTTLFDKAPWRIRLMVALTSPFAGTSLKAAARNPVQALLTGEGATALNWNKPGVFDQRVPIVVDPAVQAQVLAASRTATGV